MHTNELFNRNICLLLFFEFVGMDMTVLTGKMKCVLVISHIVLAFPKLSQDCPSCISVSLLHCSFLDIFYSYHFFHKART